MQIRNLDTRLFVADLSDNQFGTGKYPIVKHILEKRLSDIKSNYRGVALVTSGNGEAVPFYYLCNKLGLKSLVITVDDFGQSRREEDILSLHWEELKLIKIWPYEQNRKDVYAAVKAHVDKLGYYILDLREDPLGVLFAQNLYGTEVRNFLADQYKDFMATTFSIICPLDSLETTLGIARCLKTSSHLVGERADLKIIGVGSKNVNGLKPLSEASLFPTYTQFRGDKLLDEVLTCEGNWVVNNLFAGDGISLSSQGFALLNEANGLESDCVLIIQGHGLTYD